MRAQNYNDIKACFSQILPSDFIQYKTFILDYREFIYSQCIIILYTIDVSV